MIDVSVIIVNYNTKEYTRECIKSVVEATRGVSYKIYIVDNASTDDSIEMIRSEFPNVHLLTSSINGGFGYANNIALRMARSKYIFLLNSDTLLINNAISILFNFMEKEKNGNVACCGANLFDENNTPLPSYGNLPSFRQILFQQFKLNKIWPKYYETRLSPTVVPTAREIDVPFVLGATMFFRKSVLDEIGYFDEDFFLYFEDCELCFRCKSRNYRLSIIPDAKIIHLCGGSSVELHSSKKYSTIFLRSMIIYFRKCYGNIFAFFVKIFLVCSCAARLIFTYKNKSDNLQAIHAIVKS